MNIHPAFTHFPVALFTLYALMELVRFKKVLAQPYWFYVKAMFVILGTLSSYATYFTGTLIESDFGSESRVVELHSSFALGTLILFSVISLAYVVAWLGRTQLPARYLAAGVFAQLWRVASRLAAVMQHPGVSCLLALVGLAGITVTGALGGALAYGPEIDPAVSFIYHLFFRE